MIYDMSHFPKIFDQTAREEANLRIWSTELLKPVAVIQIDSIEVRFLWWRDYGLNMLAIICEAFEDIEGVWKIYTSTLQFHLCSSASSVPLQLLGILPHGFAIAWHGTGSSVELKPGLTLLRQCCDSGQSPDLTLPTKQELRDDTEKIRFTNDPILPKLSFVNSFTHRSSRVLIWAISTMLKYVEQPACDGAISDSVPWKLLQCFAR